LDTQLIWQWKSSTKSNNIAYMCQSFNAWGYYNNKYMIFANAMNILKTFKKIKCCGTNFNTSNIRIAWISRLLHLSIADQWELLQKFRRRLRHNMWTDYRFFWWGGFGKTNCSHAIHYYEPIVNEVGKKTSGISRRSDQSILSLNCKTYPPQPHPFPSCTALTSMEGCR
jgi:hypothetical protein